MTDFYLEPSDKKTKKWMVSYINPSTNRVKTIHFGAKGMSDLTIHKDIKRKERYLKRHSGMGEDWGKTGISTPGFWARHILWNMPSLKGSINHTEKRFDINIHLIE
jgi:hypothetical protein